MSPSRRLTLLSSLNALIRLAYNAGALDQHAAISTSNVRPERTPLLQVLPSSPPSHPFHTSDRTLGISDLRNAILSELSPSPSPEGDPVKPSSADYFDKARDILSSIPGCSSCGKVRLLLYKTEGQSGSKCLNCLNTPPSPEGDSAKHSPETPHA